MIDKPGACSQSPSGDRHCGFGSALRRPGPWPKV